MRWNDGTYLTTTSYQNWGSGQPSFSYQGQPWQGYYDCTIARITGAIPYKWFSEDCRGNYNYNNAYKYGFCKTQRGWRGLACS
jgi:hypothetical protein